MRKKAVFSFIVLAAALLAAIPMRTCLILGFIDPKTGFYTGGSLLITATNILLAVTAVLLMLPFFYKSLRGLKPQPGKSTLIGILCCILIALFFIDGLHEFYLLMVKKGGAGDFFNSLCEFAVTGYFAMLAVASFKGSRIEFPLGSLLPVFWATVHLMATFMHYTTVVNISEYLYDMLKLVFVMLFFYYHARYTGRVSNGNEAKGMLAFGLPAVFFSLLSVFPRYLASIGGVSLSLSPSEDLLFVVISAYILTVIVKIYGRRAEENTADQAKPEET